MYKQLFFIILFACGAQGAASSTAEVPSKAQRNVSCMLAFDDVEKDGSVGAVTFALSQGIRTIKDDQFPLYILVSRSLLKNLLQVQNNDQLSDARFSNRHVNIFYNRENDLILMAPRSIESDTDFNLSAFDQFDFHGEEHTFNDELLQWIQNLGPTRLVFSKDDFQGLLKANDTVWNVYITGHGSQDGQYIVGLSSSEQVIDLLDIFNTYVDTNVIVLNSCFIGGRNLSLLDTQYRLKERFIEQFTFILIVMGVLHDVTIGVRSLTDFFKHAQQIDRYKGLNSLLHALTEFNADKPMIPQVWLPGGLGFFTFNIEKNVLSLGLVRMRIAQQENKPILVSPETRAVLIYPYAFDAKIKLQAGERLLSENHVPFAPSAYFPRFISMVPTRANNASDQIDQYMRSVSLGTFNDQAVGVLHFIGQSLVCNRALKEQSYYIESLTGYNDFYLLEQMKMHIGAQAEIESTDIIDQSIVQPNLITLRNVYLNFEVANDGTIYTLMRAMHNGNLLEYNAQRSASSQANGMLSLTDEPVDFAVETDPEFIDAYLSFFNLQRDLLRKLNGHGIDDVDQKRIPDILKIKK